MVRRLSGVLVIVALFMGLQLGIGYSAPGGAYEPYPNLEVRTLNCKDNFVNYYILHNQKQPQVRSDNLIIYLGGSGMDCALGLKKNDQWQEDGLFVKALNEHFSPQWDILVPEKMNITLGNDHSTDEKVFRHYSVAERTLATTLVIDSFLRGHDYKNVFIVGVSEGGAILPKVYNSLGQKHKITKLISLGGGGVSQYEEFKILQTSKLPMVEEYRRELGKVDSVMREIKNNKNLTDKWYLGYPYSYWTGFLTYRPLDEYLIIEIPIFLVHGDKDTSNPVESSQTIVKEFEKNGKTNLTYWEYKDGNHAFNGDFATILTTVEAWMIK